ncbi:zinc metallopeptidase [Tissierella sp.]|uniref:zinc metallopeptidase n=1 Tax=Tissierella sp. TaxID=41274 RepID=UPI0037DD53EA
MLGYRVGYMDTSWFIYVLPAILFASYAQLKINSAFSKYSNVPSGTGYTGGQIARMILDRNGLYDVKVEQVSGKLTDHYDPRSKVVRLSTTIFGGNSIASMSVAAHEVGHAIQHSEGYLPLLLRNNLAPIANISSRFAWVLLIIGTLISWGNLITFGIILFSSVVLFQIITLPVEFNASNRALLQLENGIVEMDKIKPAKKVLKAAALTYVAATLVAIGELLRLLAMTNRRRD